MLVACASAISTVSAGWSFGSPEVQEVFPTPFPFLSFLTPAKFARDDLIHFRHFRRLRRFSIVPRPNGMCWSSCPSFDASEIVEPAIPMPAQPPAERLELMRRLCRPRQQ